MFWEMSIEGQLTLLVLAGVFWVISLTNVVLLGLLIIPCLLATGATHVDELQKSFTANFH